MKIRGEDGSLITLREADPEREFCMELVCFDNVVTSKLNLGREDAIRLAEALLKKARTAL